MRGNAREEKKFKYTFKVLDLIVAYLSEEEVDRVQYELDKGDILEGRIFKGIWHQVKSQAGVTIHLPSTIATPFFMAMADSISVLRQQPPKLDLVLENDRLEEPPVEYTNEFSEKVGYIPILCETCGHGQAMHLILSDGRRGSCAGDDCQCGVFIPVMEDDPPCGNCGHDRSYHEQTPHGSNGFCVYVRCGCEEFVPAEPKA